MTILNNTALESNKYLKINFNGGDLSSDAGLLLIKDFVCEPGFVNILNKKFKTNDGAYFEDDCADELTNDPIQTAILSKKPLLYSRLCRDFSTG